MMPFVAMLCGAVGGLQFETDTDRVLMRQLTPHRPLCDAGPLLGWGRAARFVCFVFAECDIHVSAEAGVARVPGPDVACHEGGG